MAYTPPASVPLDLDFTSAGYTPPVNPVILDLDPGAPGTVVLTGVHCVQAVACDAGAVGQTHLLSGDNAVQAALSSELHRLTGDDATQGNLCSDGALAQTHVLMGSNSLSVTTSLSDAIAQTALFAGSPCAQAVLSTDGALLQVHLLTGSPASAGQASTGGALSQVNMLSGEDALQINLSDAAPIDASIYLAGEACSQPALSGEGQIAVGWPRFAAASVNSAVQQAKPVSNKACSRQRRLNTAIRKVDSKQSAGRLQYHKIASEARPMTFNAFRYCIPYGRGVLSVNTWASIQDELTLERNKLCGTVDGAAPVAGFAAITFDDTVLSRPSWLSDVDDAAKSYHVVYRTVWDDPDVPNAFGAGFSLVSSGVPSDGFIVRDVYIPPPASPLDLDIPDAAYSPPAQPPLNLGLDHLTSVEDHFAIYPDPAAPYPPTPDFALPYSSQKRVIREVEEIGVIRKLTHADTDDNLLARDRRCIPVDAARRPPPGQSNIHVDPPRDPPPVPPVVYVIPQRIVYMINHTLSVTLLDGTPIPVSSVNLSLDVDAYAWTFRGDLADKAALPLVQQPSNGQPVQLVVTLNGVVFKVLVERIDHTRQFGQRQITLSGRGLTALLGQPYQQPQSATQASDLTVQQLAELQLPLGWAINWDLPTWIVPNGAFTYTAQTPIQVLKGMADDIGAIIKPSRDTQAMTFMRRYKVGPWQFSQATPDLYVPEAAILSATLRPPVPIDINGVYVHGSEIGGIIGWCRLTGTDGAKLAQTVSNNLITDVEGARLLGERLLAANQTQPALQSITLPFDNVDFPLADVGWLTQITLDSNTVRGIVNAVNITATLGGVRQTLQIGEETPNNWSLFNDLLPRDPLLVGTLSSTNGVTSLMTLLDGGVIRVRGTGSVGSKYYVRGSKIESAAPNLNLVEIVV